MKDESKINNNDCPFCNPKPVSPYDDISGNEEKWRQHQYHQQ